MPLSSKLLAWVEPKDRDGFLAAFVSVPTATKRRPATQRCASPEEARQWVEREAAALGLPVSWMSAAPDPIER
jgi:hypothetical protein